MSSGFNLGFNSSPKPNASFGIQQQPNHSFIQPGFGMQSKPLSNMTNNPGLGSNVPPVTIATLQQRMNQIAQIVDPNAPSCAFRHIFYNRVNPAELHRYQRPGDFDPYLWEQAQQLNPDPTCMVPHQARGFRDLKQRIEAQDKETEVQLERLADAESFLASVVEKHSLDTAVCLSDLKRASLLLGHRLLTIAGRIEVLRAHNLPIQPDEDLWRQKLTNQQLELAKPNQFNGRLHELASRIRMQKAQDIRPNRPILTSNDLPSQEVQRIAQILQQQQQGIEHLIEIIQADLHNMNIITQHLDTGGRDI